MTPHIPQPHRPVILFWAEGYPIEGCPPGPNPRWLPVPSPQWLPWWSYRVLLDRQYLISGPNGVTLTFVNDFQPQEL